MERISNSLGIRSGQPGARGNRFALATAIASYLGAGSFAAAAYFCKAHRLAPLAKKGSLALVGLGSAVGIGRAATRCFSTNPKLPDGPKPFDLSKYELNKEEAKAKIAELMDGDNPVSSFAEIENLYVRMGRPTNRKIFVPYGKLTGTTQWREAEVVAAWSYHMDWMVLRCDLLFAELYDRCSGASDPVQEIGTYAKTYTDFLKESLRSYHRARGSATFTKSEKGYLCTALNPEANAKAFYDPTSPQAKWRAKYHRACELLAPIIPHITGHEEEFRSLTRPDLSPKTYTCPLTVETT